MIKDFQNDTLLLELSEEKDIELYQQTLQEASKLGIHKVLLVCVSDYYSNISLIKAIDVCTKLKMKVLPSQLFYKGEFFDEAMMCKTDDKGKIKQFAMSKMETFNNYKNKNLGETTKNKVKVINFKEMK